jgi:hypothetical protein
MNSEQKLERALECIEELIKLTENNEYQKFLYRNLISMQVELKRQLTNLQYHSKIKE